MRLRDTNRGGGGGRRAVGRGCGAPPATSTHPQGGTRGTWVPVPGCPRGGGSAAISRLSQPHVPKPLHRHSTRGGSGETPPRFSPAVDKLLLVISQDLGSCHTGICKALAPTTPCPGARLGFGVGASFPALSPPPQEGEFRQSRAGSSLLIPAVEDGQLLPQLPVQVLEHRLGFVELLLSLRGGEEGAVGVPARCTTPPPPPGRAPTLAILASSFFLAFCRASRWCRALS